MASSARGRLWPLFVAAVRRNTCPMLLSRIPGTDRFRVFKRRTFTGVLTEADLPKYIRNRREHVLLARGA
jgi:hypothetical protein